MSGLKTKSIEQIEKKMQDLDKDSLRYQILQSAKRFKASWIELGEALYTVWKDKLYKEWGFLTFDAYVSKEIGIKKQTALKLVRSYYFLKKEGPVYLDKDYAESAKVTSIPTYEAINVLRLAKNKKALDEKDYENLKKEVFEKGKEARELKKDLTALVRQRQDVTPEEVRKKKRDVTLKRFLTTLKALKRDLEISRLVPASIIKDADALIKKIEAEI